MSQLRLNKFGIIIVIEDIKGNIFGGFIRSRIIRWKDEFVSTTDCNIYPVPAFLFRLRTKGKQNKDIFKINDGIIKSEFSVFAENNVLFKFGMKDLIVKKEEKKYLCLIDQDEFNYQGKINALLGNDPTYHNEVFEIKEFKVYWMKIRDQYTYSTIDPVRNFFVTPDVTENTAIKEKKKSK